MSFYVKLPQYDEDGNYEGIFPVIRNKIYREWPTKVEASLVAMPKHGQVFDRATNRMVEDHTPIRNLVPHEDRSVKQLRKDPKWVASQVFVNA